MVEELAARAGMPMPRVFLMHEPQPNAFATGRNPEHGVVAVTTGILQPLDERELRGVPGARAGPHQEPRHPGLQHRGHGGRGRHLPGARGGLLRRGEPDDEGPSPVQTLLLALVAPLAATLIQLGIPARASTARTRPARRSPATPRRWPGPW